MFVQITEEKLVEDAQQIQKKRSQLPIDVREWNSNQRQTHLDLIQKWVSNKEALELNRNQAQEFFFSAPFNINKELLISILIILCQHFHVRHTRAETRFQQCAWNLLNKHWPLFSPVLSTLSIVTVKDPSNGRTLSYEIHLLNRVFHTDSKGKVQNLYNNRRCPKCNQVLEIERGEAQVSSFLGSSQVFPSFEESINSVDSPGGDDSSVFDQFDEFIDFETSSSIFF